MKSDAIIGAVQGVTKKWAKQRKAEEREASARTNRSYAMTRGYHVSIKNAAWQIMEEAYQKASDNGRLPAHARQVMYAARGYIQRTADRPLGKKFDQYFTQTLLPDFIEEQGVDWNVVYDARGNLHEPHTDKTVPLGTLQVRDYLGDVGGHSVDEPEFDIVESHYPTLGPKSRYSAILFIEKEGFMPLFSHVKLAERYDIAIMSTKGMSVTASRELVDDLCGEHDIPLLVLHDFDKAGFSIFGTLDRDTRRYQFHNSIEVIDLGMKLGDIDGLETESVFIQSEWAARENLHENGATEEEIEFLLHQRVELNAFPSADLVAWIESKLDAQGITKLVPDDDVITDAYRRARRLAAIQTRVDEVLAEFDEDIADKLVPDALKKRIEKSLEEDPARSWDEAVKDIAAADCEAGA